MLSNLYVLGSDHKLWLEAPGWQQHGRTYSDSNVQAFAPSVKDVTANAPVSSLYVEGTDGKLWLEGPGWQEHGRTYIDSNVLAFAPDGFAPGELYVEGTDHKLWHEAPGWQFSPPVPWGSPAAMRFLGGEYKNPLVRAAG